MSRVVIKKKHLRYVFYVSILSSMVFFKKEFNEAPSESSSETIGSSTDGSGLGDDSPNHSSTEGYDNQFDSPGSYENVVINETSQPDKGNFSTKFGSRSAQRSTNIETRTDGDAGIEMGGQSIAMQLEAAPNRTSEGSGRFGRSKSVGAKFKSFASVGGAFGGGESLLGDEDPPGGPENPTQVPFDNEIYIVLFLGIIIGFYSLRQKKVAV